MRIQPIVIGTAGHIDHGKSTLVRALTGVDPDRLKEERERGLTIDLGFAPLDLPDGRKVGIVDVPGHERFIRNMVAGASGIDLVVLVVAADDGVMPQTREHLAIMQLLGVERGFVALTKIDAVEPEMVEMAAEDIAESVSGTFLEGAPVIPISALSGMGMDELRATLFELAQATPARSDSGVFRMPVQRVFSSHGFGTVLTGIPVSGQVRVGEVLEVLPGGRRGKVRGLQAYREPAELARAGHSTAINLADIDHKSVERGCVVATPGFFKAVTMLGVSLKALPSLQRPIENRTAIRVHTGTAEVLGEVVLLDSEELAPGQEGLAQLRLSGPIVCAPNDRFVLRLASPALTLGGGLVLEESRHRLKRFKAFVLEELGEQASRLSEPDGLLEVTLLRAPGLVALQELAVTVKLAKPETKKLLEELRTKGRAASPGAPDQWIHPQRLDAQLERLSTLVQAWFDEHKERQRLDVRELRSRAELDPQLFGTLLDELERREVIVRASGGQLELAGRSVDLDPESSALRERLLGLLQEAAFQPPDPGGLAQTLACPRERVERLLELCVDLGQVERVAKDLFLTRPHFENARERVVDNCERNGTLLIPELRDALKTTRKFLIPLLEHLDAQGVTLRQGGHRVLKRR